MAEYREPIRVAGDDPLCTATALNGTVIGILFEKTGKELKTAIQSRIVNIDTQIGKHKAVVGEVTEFLSRKEIEIEELDRFYSERQDGKKEKLLPLQREMATVQKRMTDMSMDFERETEKLLGGKAVNFEKDFDAVQESLKRIDQYVQEERWSAKKLLRSSSMGYTGSQGCQGPNGYVGVAGTPGVYASISKDDSDEVDDLTEEENRALARLNSLKQLVRSYADKTQRILGEVERLGEEKRRLRLIHDNLMDDRTYKLDLNKLSAFGFEDVVVV